MLYKSVALAVYCAFLISGYYGEQHFLISILWAPLIPSFPFPKNMEAAHFTSDVSIY